MDRHVFCRCVWYAWAWKLVLSYLVVIRMVGVGIPASPLLLLWEQYFYYSTGLSKSDDSQISVRVVPAGRCPFHVMLSAALLLMEYNKNQLFCLVWACAGCCGCCFCAGGALVAGRGDGFCWCAGAGFGCPCCTGAGGFVCPA